MKVADHSSAKSAFIATMGRLRPETAFYGYCFDDYFTLVLTKRYTSSPPKVALESLKYIFRVLVHLANIVRLSQKKLCLPRFMFTSVNPRAHLKTLIQRTLPYLPKGECAIFQFSGESDMELASAIHGPEALHRSARLRDSFPALSDLFKIWKLLGVYDPDLSLKLRLLVTVGIWHTHVRASVAYAAYKRLLADSALEALVVEYDHNSKTVPLVLAAKNTGKYVFTFQHGLINSPGGYDPVIADKIFVWGDFFRDTLIQYGVAEDKIEVTGCQSIDESKLSYRSDDSIKLIYATTAYTDQENRQLAAGIEQALAKLPELDYKLAVKPHPSDRLEYGLDKEAPEEVVSLSTLDSLPWCDILICHNTTIALDAMRMGKLVLLIDWLERSLSETMQRLEDEGCCVAVQSPDELGDCLKRYSSGDNGLEQIRAHGAKYAKQFYEAIGDAAGANAAKAILSVVQI